jgi:large subunit ribosomal protein L4
VLGGAAKKDVSLTEAVFAAEVKPNLVHEAVRAELNAARAGTRGTKSRGLVAGGRSKPWRQKGTGRARVGEIRNPLWRKGGTVFGPQPRSYEYHLPKKMFRSALRSALAVKLKENQLNIVDAFSLADHKTKAFAQALTRLGFDRKILVIDNQDNPNLWRAASNIAEVDLIPSLQVTPYQLLNARHVVFSKSAIQALEEVLKK